MESKEMVRAVIDSQIELLKQTSDALTNVDFITAGMTLKAVGTICTQLAESLKPFALLDYIMQGTEGKIKMKTVEENISKTHKLLVELFKNDSEGLPKQ